VELMNIAKVKVLSELLVLKYHLIVH